MISRTASSFLSKRTANTFFVMQSRTSMAGLQLPVEKRTAPISTSSSSVASSSAGRSPASRARSSTTCGRPPARAASRWRCWSAPPTRGRGSRPRDEQPDGAARRLRDLGPRDAAAAAARRAGPPAGRAAWCPPRGSAGSADSSRDRVSRRATAGRPIRPPSCRARRRGGRPDMGSPLCRHRGRAPPRVSATATAEARLPSTSVGNSASNAETREHGFRRDGASPRARAREYLKKCTRRS